MLLEIKSILLIEDEEDQREGVNKLLEDEGYKVTCAANGKEGIDIYRKQHFDLVLSDLHMEDGSGVDFFIQVKELHIDKEPMPPVIFVSGYGGDPRLDILIKEGALFIQKPFRLSELLEMIKTALKQ